MEVELIRYNHDRESSSGLIAIDNEFECYSLEDERREVKVKGETRIPEGRYELKLRKVKSGLTKKYRQRYNWFTWHIELQDVPNFEFVYIHIGNEEKHSDACILAADRAWNDPNDYSAYQSNSAIAFERIYKRIVPHLESGGRAFINIKSIWE